MTVVDQSLEAGSLLVQPWARDARQSEPDRLDVDLDAADVLPAIRALVEAEPAPQVRHDLGARVLPRQDDRGIPGHQAEQDEDDGADEEQRRDELQETAKEEGQHGGWR